MHMPFRQIFLLFWADFLRRFLPLFVVFDPSTTATSCQDAYFFPAMIYIYIYVYVFCLFPDVVSSLDNILTNYNVSCAATDFNAKVKKVILWMYFVKKLLEIFLENSFLKLATLLNYQPINCFGSLMTRSLSSRTRKSRIQSGGPGKEKTQNKR